MREDLLFYFFRKYHKTEEIPSLNHIHIINKYEDMVVIKCKSVVRLRGRNYSTRFYAVNNDLEILWFYEGRILSRIQRKFKRKFKHKLKIN